MTPLAQDPSFARLKNQLIVATGLAFYADRDELLAWVGAMQRKPKRTFLVHGEGQAQFTLAEALKTAYGIQVDVPEWKQQVEV